MSDALRLQNDRTSIILQKAVYYCLRKEKMACYIIIAMSVTFCISSIVNKHIHVFLGMAGVVYDPVLQNTISNYLVVCGGLFSVFQIFITRFAIRMHREGICIMERCDCYVLGISTNKAIMRPLSEAVIETYAAKVSKPEEHFKNSYFSHANGYDKSTQNEIIFAYQKEQIVDNYRLMLGIHTFFLTLWIIFGLFIFAMALFTKYDFLLSLVQILVPSLSVISMIFSSSYSYSEAMRRLTNIMNNMNAMDDSQKNMLTLRGLQDAIFSFRMSDFLIPDFLIKRHRKKMERETWGYTLTGHHPMDDFGIRKYTSVTDNRYNLRTMPLPPRYQAEPSAKQVALSKPSGKELKKLNAKINEDEQIEEKGAKAKSSRAAKSKQDAATAVVESAKPAKKEEVKEKATPARASARAKNSAKDTADDKKTDDAKKDAKEKAEVKERAKPKSEPKGKADKQGAEDKPDSKSDKKASTKK